MGCSQSSAQGSDNIVSPKEFFPPPESTTTNTNQANTPAAVQVERSQAGTVTASSTSSTPHLQHSTTDSKPTNSSGGQAIGEAAKHPSSPAKKKTPYVPPPQIGPALAEPAPTATQSPSPKASRPASQNPTSSETDPTKAAVPTQPAFQAPPAPQQVHNSPAGDSNKSNGKTPPVSGGKGSPKHQQRHSHNSNEKANGGAMGETDNENALNEVGEEDPRSQSKAGAASGYSSHPDLFTPIPGSESGLRFDELYRLKGVLGTGAFSTVREGFHRNNSDISFAVKCINRRKLSEEDEAALLDEVAILKEMKHIHIIRLYDFFEEPSTYYLVMERMRGGELFDRIVAKAYYNEKEARDTCKILLLAVEHCHMNHVAHRDLKPENLLLLSEDDDSAVKIADFGFAKKVYQPNSLTTQCGTPGYVAPEILEGTPYDHRADMWSVGVILYILLGGYPPFIESTQRDLFRKIRKGEYEFHEEYWGTVSEDAKQLIASLLTVDSSQRLTAKDALLNGWILGDDARLAKKDLGLNLEKFRNFNAKRKLRAAVSAVIAMNKLNALGSEFIKSIDHDDEDGAEGAADVDDTAAE